MNAGTVSVKNSTQINISSIWPGYNICHFLLNCFKFLLRKSILLCLALLLFSKVFVYAQEPPYFEIIEIDTTSFDNINSLDMNNLGQVVGHVSVLGEFGWNAYIWEEGSFTLMDLDGRNNAYEINDSGWVIGLHQGQTNYGFLWKDGVITDLGQLAGGSQTSPSHINNQGQIIGRYQDENFKLRPFLYFNGTITEIIGPENQRENSYPQVNGINNDGTIIGTSWLENGGAHATIWQEENIITLSPPSTGWAINDSGYAAVMQVVDNSDSYSYLYKDGFIDTMFINEYPRTINEKNQAITYSGQLYYNGEVYNIFDFCDLTIEGWTSVNFATINNAGQISGEGVKDGKFKSFILKPQKLSITSHNDGRLLFSCDLDTIRWVANDEVENVNIFYSTDLNDGFGNFAEIAKNYPADSGYYIWQVVDTLASKAFINIESSDFSTEVTSKAFAIKDFSLTRMNENNEFERFDVTKHGWSFCNCKSNLFPETWYEQFDYLFGEDPYTEEDYPEWFTEQTVNAAPFWFPDWPSFVRAFGTDAAYHINIPGILSIYKEATAEKWGAIHDQDRWGGSCSGMVTSALLAFAFKDEFNASYPDIGATDEIYSITGSSLIATSAKDIAIRKLSNQLYIHWFGKEAQDHAAFYNNQVPRFVLMNIKNMFRDITNNKLTYLYLSNQNGPGAHAVGVYRIKRDPASPNVWRLYIYDPNRPGDDNQFVTLDSLANTWSYPLNASTTWGGNTGMFLMNGIKSYLSEAEAQFQMASLKLKSTMVDDTIIPYPGDDNPKVEIYTTKYADTKFTSSTGEEAGVNIGIASNNILGARFIRSPTGKETPPSGLIAPIGHYTVKIKDPPNAAIFAKFFSDTSVYSYQRMNVSPEQTDVLIYDQNSLQVTHSDDPMPFLQKKSKLEGSQVFVKGISLMEDQEIIFQLNNVQYEMNDSLNFSVNQNESAELSLGQGGGSYDLLIRKHTADSSKKFIHTDVEMAAGSMHKIVPIWGEALDSVLIEVDNDTDGITDEFFKVDNQYLTTGIDRIKYTPNNEFLLSQNYPNPFNTATNIDFFISEKKHIQLDVYDISGKCLRTLTKGFFEPGMHTVKFDSGNLQEGVYLYRLRSGIFDEWKKCMIIK